MATYQNRSHDQLVTLHLPSPFELHPMPDSRLEGRLNNVLRSVGAKKSISVRARMITAVADTKFKTEKGDPVSLVGLHGKDEILAIGPDWAIRRLAEGERPLDPSEMLAQEKITLSKIHATLDQIESELKLAQTGLDFINLTEKACIFISKHQDELAAQEARPEFRRVTGYEHQNPVFIHYKKPNEDISTIQAEYDNFLALELAMNDARRVISRASARNIKPESFNDAKTQLANLKARVTKTKADFEDLMPNKSKVESCWWYSWSDAWIHFCTEITSFEKELQNIKESNQEIKYIKSSLVVDSIGKFDGDTFVEYSKA